MTGPLPARRNQPDRLPCVFRPGSTVNDVSTGLPCALPFGSVLVGLVDEPVDSLLRGADYNPYAAVSQDKGDLPTMYHHGCSPTFWAPEKVNPPVPSIVPRRSRNTFDAAVYLRGCAKRQEHHRDEVAA
jgi:hypothetical protein